VDIILFFYFCLIALTIYTSLNYKANEKVAIIRYFRISTLFGIYFFLLFGSLIYLLVNFYFNFQPGFEFEININKKSDTQVFTPVI
jgi:hypothetical protein